MIIIGELQSLTTDRNGYKLLTIATKAKIEDEYDNLYGQKINCEIKPHRAKRSLDANAYFWVLCDKLSAKTKIPKDDIYKNYIRNIGGNSETICIQSERADEFCQIWQKNGHGWFTETTSSKISGCTNITCYYGSSVFDSSQMARLIEMVVEDCKDEAIETMTPQELESLINNWR